MTLATRLLGLAFASADALIELDKQGVVRFALGAGPVPTAPIAQWVGHPLADRLSPEGAAALKTLILSLPAGHRSPPLDVAIDCGGNHQRMARLHVFRLPELAPAVSCSLSYTDKTASLRPATVPASSSDELPEAQDMLANLRFRLHDGTDSDVQKLALAFVDVAGMDSVPSEQRPEIYAGLNATLRSISLDGQSAGRLAHDRYAVVHAPDNGRDIDAEIRAIGENKGVPLSSKSGNSPLGSDPASALRAMRFAIEACLREDNLENPEAHFAEALQRTLRDAERFRNIVRDRDFELHYQPIVDLKTRTVHHHEALSRFPRSTSPGPAIRMAEELALIESFDRTVAEMAINRLNRPENTQLKVAVNVSGASLSNDSYVSALLAMTADTPQTRNRLLIEVTETAALADIGSANRRLTALKNAGVRICIDDFGVGSASFDYLRGLNADIVKIDGTLVRGLTDNSRHRTMIAHLVELCRSLEMVTVAEMVETESEAITLHSLGVTHGQGWLFGKAEPEPRTQINTPPSRRKGAMDSWG
ncbi:EAL domain-containing protein [Brevundimonas sp.]|uniref:EAL domain-containing protein n=2 Tax=Brevundimonas sp. TaxID=1871086 RepID=UPI002FCCB10B